MAKKYQMTKPQAIADFKENVAPVILARYGVRDRVAMRCGWNDYVDSLNKDGWISDYHAMTWTNPFK